MDQIKLSQIYQKRLFIFDFNFDNKDSKIIDNFVFFHKLINKTQKQPTIIIVTTSSLNIALIFLEKYKINGYLIANNGTIIFDLNQKKITHLFPLKKEELAAFIHHSLMLNLNIIVHTTEQNFFYCSNIVSYKKQKENFLQKNVIINYQQLHTKIEKDNIVSLILFNDFCFNDDTIRKLENYYLQDENTDISANIDKKNKFIYINKKNCSKLKAIEIVRNLLKIEKHDDILYIAVTDYDQQCFTTFKNAFFATHSLCETESLNINNYKFLDLNKEINNLNTNLKTNENNL